MPVVEKHESLSSKPLIIRDAFMDIYETTLPSYINGQLNPKILCHVLKDHEKYEKCLNAVQNITCEIEMLNGKLDHEYLQHFFYSYWQSDIFIATENNNVEIYSMALRFDELYNFTLQHKNVIQLIGSIIDLHITPNGKFNAAYD